MNDEFIFLQSANGEIQAEILRGLLESHSIQVQLSRESIGMAYGLIVGPLGEVQLWVLQSQVAIARQILQDYDSGKFDTD